MQILVEMRLYPSEDVIFAEQTFDHTPPDDGHAPYALVPKKWHWMTKRSKLSLLFLLCGGLRSYKSIKAACQRGWKTALLNRRIQHCWSRLQQFRIFGASLTGSLVFCIHSSRLSLFCSNHLQGRHYFRSRQTVENHPIHTGTNSCRCIT